MDSEVYENQPRTNLARVTSDLAGVILEWCKSHEDQEFRMENMRAFIQFRGHRCAPASPDRILRSLRQQGLVNYDVVSRKGSLYRITECSA